MKRIPANRRGTTAILIDAVLFALAMVGAIPHSLAIAAEALPEYRLKAAFIYNFAVFTEWPATVGSVLEQEQDRKGANDARHPIPGVGAETSTRLVGHVLLVEDNPINQGVARANGYCWVTGYATCSGP